MLNTSKGLAHIMSVMAEEEKSNQAFVSALLSNQAPAAVPPAAPAAQLAQPIVSSVSVASSLPATAMKLAGILKNRT